MIAFIFMITILPALAFAHPGGLDSKDCHHDRKRGGYHCHRAQPSETPQKQKADPEKVKAKAEEEKAR